MDQNSPTTAKEWIQSLAQIPSVAEAPRRRPTWAWTASPPVITGYPVYIWVAPVPRSRTYGRSGCDHSCCQIEPANCSSSRSGRSHGAGSGDGRHFVRTLRGEKWLGLSLGPGVWGLPYRCNQRYWGVLTCQSLRSDFDSSSISIDGNASGGWAALQAPFLQDVLEAVPVSS